MSLFTRLKATIALIFLISLAMSATFMSPHLGTTHAASTSGTLANWPQVGENPQHTCVNPAERMLSPSTVSRLTLAWSYATRSEGVSGAVVANGLVYVAALDGTLSALDARTGSLTWHYTSSSALESSPIVAGGLVYVGSFDGTMYALHATTGALHWRSKLGGHIYNAPTLVQGVLYIGAAVDTGRLYVHTLSALDAATGKLRWSYTLPGYFLFTTPAVDRGVIYVGSDAGRVMALDTATGKLIWTFAAGGSVYAAPSAANGLVYVSTSAGGRGLYALNARTGTLAWSYLPPDGNGGFFGSPAVANGVVYVSSYGVEMALDTRTGKPLWSYATGGVIYVPTVVDNGMVYVGSSNGTFYAFALQQGSWEKQARTWHGDRLWGMLLGNTHLHEEWPKLSGTRVTRIAAELTTLVRVCIRGHPFEGG